MADNTFISYNYIENVICIFHISFERLF